MRGLFNRDRQPSLKRASFMLTERGRGRLSDDFSSGSATTRTLIALETLGSANLAELSREAQVPVGQMEELVTKLLDAGFAQSSSGGMDDA